MSDPGATAQEVVRLLREERFADVEARFAPALKSVASADTVRAAWATEMARTGPLSAVDEPVVEDRRPDLTRVSVPTIGERGNLTVRMSLDQAGIVHGLRLVPSAGRATWTPPAYATRRRSAEQPITVGHGSLAVDGTLMTGRSPLGWPRRRPAVVLLSGGGPFDRDGTVGPNKPIKDLAWGLAARGIASIRFDKVTYAHGEEVAQRPDFTMADEYVPYATAAVRLLQQQPGIDPGRVYVLGHSMGGKVAARVAVAEPSIAGLVILAGDTEPMHHAAIRVARHIARLTPGAAADEAIRTATRQASVVDSPELSAATPNSDLPFGLSASYWLDLRGYDPVEVAASIRRANPQVSVGREVAGEQLILLGG